MKNIGTYAKVQSTVQTWYDTYQEEISKKDVLAIHYAANPETVTRAYNMAIGDLRRTNLVKEVTLDQNWQQFKTELSVVIVLTLALGVAIGAIFFQ